LIVIAIQQRLERFYFDYASCLDEQRYHEWPQFFNQQCRYEILSRENVSQGLPVPLMSCYSHGMVSDRVVMLVNKTLTYRKMYWKHLVSNVRIEKEEPDVIHSSANVLVIQSDLEGLSSINIVGTYNDIISTRGPTLAITSRRVVIDSFGIDNMLAVPI
jgi:anthranilate 1,2-dioxygenase small subunit